MLAGNNHFKTIWIDKKNKEVLNVIDQNELPFKFKIKKIRSLTGIADAINNMTVRGAPLIGITAVYGLYFACLEFKKQYPKNQSFEEYISHVYRYLTRSRPTAVNLKALLDRVIPTLLATDSIEKKISLSLKIAIDLSDEDIKINKNIGKAGLDILKKIKGRKKILNILTHCNAGWLATVDYGTALSPVYLASQKGMKIHVWVEETRPRNQGSRLTAWELYNMNIPHSVITDNAGGYVMQKGLVDVVIVGSDRTSLNGDVCNKIGTYKTALAAYDNKIPFYAAVPSISFDFKIDDAMNQIPIEEREVSEIEFIEGIQGGKNFKIRIGNKGSVYKNYGFDITPSRFITGLITDKGVIKACRKEIIKIKNPD